MSEFEKELESILEKNGEYYQGITTGNVLVISKHFKDWQPPEELVEVQQIVADFIKTLKIRGIKPLMDSATFGEIGFTEEKRDEILHWINEHQEEYMRAWIYDYTVEKEKKYLLKHIDLSKQHKYSSLYLAHSKITELKHEIYPKDVDMSKFKQCHFTQSEIDELHTGSYEQIEVEP